MREGKKLVKRDVSDQSDDGWVRVIVMLGKFILERKKSTLMESE